MSSRDVILGRIRDALGRTGSDVPNQEALLERTTQHARHIEPIFAEPPEQRFQQKLEAAAATFARVEHIDDVASEIERYLGSLASPFKLVSSGDPLIRSITWPSSFEVSQRVPTGEDLVGITATLYGIAETGTLMLASGETRPTSLNFLPDYHIVVLRRDQLVTRMEDAWDGLRQQFSGMPRTVNFISGPSKTADVEQTVEYGAHGPRCLHVVMVG